MLCQYCLTVRLVHIWRNHETSIIGESLLYQPCARKSRSGLDKPLIKAVPGGVWAILRYFYGVFKAKAYHILYVQFALETGSQEADTRLKWDGYLA